MVTTGIVRKVDNLGRIVIPKELRYTLGIKPGDDFEIIIESETIILKKYSKIKDSKETIIEMIKSIRECIAFSINLIVDNKDFESNRKISNSIKILIDERRIIKNVDNLKIFDEETLSLNNIIYPIVLNGDLIGTIVAYGNFNTLLIEEVCKITANLVKKKIVEL